MKSIQGAVATFVPQKWSEALSRIEAGNFAARVSEEVDPTSMFLTASCFKRRMAFFGFLCVLLTVSGLNSPANAQKTSPLRPPTPTQAPVRTTPVAPQTIRPAAATPVRSAGGRAYGAVPLLHFPGQGNTTYLPAGVTTRRLSKSRQRITGTRGKLSRVQIGNAAPVNVNEKVVNLTIKYTVPDVRTPFWSSDEKSLYYSSNQDPTTLGTSAENQVAANGRHHLFYISSSIPGTIGTASTPIAINDPTDANDYLYPAINANNTSITFLRSSDGKAVTDPTKLWVLCYALIPAQGTFIDPNATVVAGPTVTFPNSSGTLVPFGNVQRPTWLGNTSIVFSGELSGDTSFHLFQVNLNTSSGGTSILQLTAGLADERNPAVSPDGKIIAFDSNALPALGAVGTGTEAYPTAGQPRTVNNPTATTPTSSSMVNLPGSLGTVNRNIYTMNIFAIADPAVPGAIIPAYTVRQFTERYAGALDFDNVEPAWSSLNQNQYSNIAGGTNPDGTATQNEYLAFASTRQVTFDPNDPTSTVVTSFAQGKLHHIYYVLATNNAGTTVFPEGPVGSTISGGTPPFQAIYLDTGDSVTTPLFDDEYPTWAPFISSFRMGFQSDRNGDYYTNNFDGYTPSGQATNSFSVTPGRNSLFVATVIDITAPTLLRFNLNNPTGEVVHINLVTNPKEPFDPTTSVRNSDDGIAPGSQLHFAVRVEDRESGLRPDKAVFLQIKNPNSKYQSLAQGSTSPAEHKEYTNFLADPFTIYAGNNYYVPYDNGGFQGFPGSGYTAYGAEYEAEAVGVTNNITKVATGNNGTVLTNSATMGSTYFGHSILSLGQAGGSSALATNDVLYEAGFEDSFAFAGGSLPALDGTGGEAPVWLELKPLEHFDPATGNLVLDSNGNAKPWLPTEIGSNQPGGGVLYGASLTLSQEPSDWYLDVILYDNAVDPFDTAEQSNAIIYDNVWGFSSAPSISPQQAADILFVSDYTLGQKFFNSRFPVSSSSASVFNNLLPIDFGAESYYTDVDVAKLLDGQPTPPLSVGGKPGVYDGGGPFAFVGPFLLTTVQPTGSALGLNPLTGAVVVSGIPNTLGVKSYSDELLSPFSTTVDNQNLPNAGRYSIWRILSRGPVPSSLLAAYLPSQSTEVPDTFTNPATKAPFQLTSQVVQNAQRMVIWAAPFSGDLFPGPGTILDIATQNNLQNYVSQGGRLFLSGQDIAFGLTSSGATSSAFLTNVLQVAFNADQSDNGSITPAANVGPTYTRRIQNDAWQTVHHAYGHFVGTPGFDYDPPGSGNVPLTFNLTTTGGDGAYTTSTNTVNGNLILTSDDVVTATPTTPVSATVLTPSAYAVFNHAGAQGMTYATYGAGIAVFASFGFETISNDWYTYTPTGATVAHLATFARRAEIMHNIVCSLRSGTLTGQVIDTNGAGVAGALVRAIPSGTQEATLAAGTGVTDSGGNYRIVGLQPDAYTVFAYKNGFLSSSQHINGSIGSMHGTGIATVNVVLKPSNPGSISGFALTTATRGNSGGVFQADGKTPIAGIAVQARQLDLNNAKYDIVAASTVSAADGSYSLPSIAIGNYIIICNPMDQNKAYNPNESSVQITSAPNAGFQLSSGETVNTDNTVTIAQNQNFGANFFLSASPQAVSGQVLNSASGNAPIAGATVTAVVTGTTTVVANATTDASGNYALTYTGGATASTLVAAGTYTVTATKAGFSTNSVTVVVGGNSTTSVTAPTIYLTVLPPGTVYGLVQVSVSGQTTTSSAAGSTVSLYPINSAGQPDTTQTPITATVSGVVSQAVVSGIDDSSTATTPVINSGVTISYNFSIPNVPGGSSPGVTYIAILTPPSGSGLASDPAQLKVIVESATTTYNASFTLEPPHTYASGLQLVSLPGDYSNVPSTAGIFGLSAASNPADFNAFNVAEWTGSTYSISPSIKPQASKGYFVRFNNAAGIVEAGAPITSSSYTISLTPGWNLIGNPFTDQTDPSTASAAIDLTNPAQATFSYTTTAGVPQNHVPLAQAISDNAVGASPFFYTGSGNGAQYIESALLMGYLGYWYEAFVPVQITLVYPGSSTSRAARGPVTQNGSYQTITRAQMYAAPAQRSITSKGLMDWRQQLSIRQGEYSDTDNSIGVSGDTRSIWDNRYDAEKPPVANDVAGISLAIAGTGPTGRAASLADSVQASSSATKKWTVSVSSTTGSSQPITIYWPNIDRLPRGIEPVLVDSATGRRIAMRSGSSSYQFKPSGKSASVFQIEVAPPVSLPLEVINLRTNGTRVANRTSFHFSFVTTRNADITTQIQTLSGKTIRSMSTRAASTVQSDVVWDGRSDIGTEVGPGPMVLVIRAVDDDGNQVQRKVIFMKL